MKPVFFYTLYSSQFISSSVRLETDREEVATKLDRHGFLTMPVVNNENILQGIVTLDDRGYRKRNYGGYL